MSISIFNELETIYQNGILNEGDSYICSVCGKSYNNPKLALNHINKLSCHTTKQVFEGTLSEDKLYDIGKYVYDIFRACVHHDKIGKSITKKQFLNNKSLYGFVGKLYLFAISNGITDVKDYFSYVVYLNSDRWKYLNQIFKIAISEEFLLMFREDRRNNISDQESERFLLQNKHNLIENPSFFIQALTRGDVGIGYFCNHINIDEFIYQISDVEKITLSSLVVKYLKD